MSIVRTEITLVNPVDVGNARRGAIKPSEVRQITVNAVVDTSAWTLVINEAIRAQLGLEIQETGESEVAGGKKEKCGITDAVSIRWQDRHTACEAVVLPDEKEVLLGALPLEGMDLIIHPRQEEIVGAHGDTPLYIIK
jgi:clan AA aspartic protease